jgi:hypothetical protein
MDVGAAYSVVGVVSATWDAIRVIGATRGMTEVDGADDEGAAEGQEV